MLARSIFISAACVALSLTLATAQKLDIQRIEPAFWWVGMKNSELQILVYGKDIGATEVSVQYAGVEISHIEKTDNPNYQFVYLNISPAAQPGIMPLQFQTGKKKKLVNYELKSREKPGTAFKGFTSADVLYLIMPDRFANGDQTNDWQPGMLEKPNRAEPFFRHGGDLKGIENNLDYIQALGVTALWLNPVLENNQPHESYHGYAITDFYKVDPRLGTNESYKSFVTKSHEKGLKVVMDMVFNHTGNENWFFKDPPARDWYHQKSEYGNTNYRVSVPSDPHASRYDIDKMEKGWFVDHMPDLNQKNPLLAQYLIQNSIWWIEYAQLDGIRMDTHGYNDKYFMSDWCKRVLTEYPAFNIVGEVWDDRVVPTAYFQPDSKNPDGYQGNLPSVTDFPLQGALGKAFNEKDGWSDGVAKIYYTLVQDFMYTRPNDNVIFLDNHDMSRFATIVGGDLSKQKMGFAVLLTMRGTPQLFYGCEIGMPGDGGNHGMLRADMPGGWKGDPTSVFTAAGRTSDQNELFTYLQTLLTWRKRKPVVHQGKLMHFVPEDGVYVYFRYTDSESVMVITNNNPEAKTIDTKRFHERLTGFSRAKNIVTNESLANLQGVSLPAKTVTILELQK